MKMLATMTALLFVTLLTPLLSTAQDDVPLTQGILATAKMAGACGILDSMIQMQTMTKLPGGDEFVTRFWSVEAARLGDLVPSVWTAWRPG